MSDVQALRAGRREFIADGPRSQLRATWHFDSRTAVISLWRADRCVATSHLTPAEAGRLSAFLTGGLADVASDGRVRRSRRRHRVGRPWQERVVSFLRHWRRGAAGLLGSLARRVGA